MKTMVMCAGCDQPIYDRYLLHVLDKAWHSSCVTCCECKILLVDKCFSRDNRLFCKDDFFKRYGTKCAGCNQVIAMNDLVRRARDKVFHIDCFCCMSCQKRLDTGEELYIINGCKFLCKEDYINSRQGTIPNSTGASECGSDIDNDDDELCDELFSPSKHDISKSSTNDDGDQSSPESTPSQQQTKSQDENNGGSNGNQGGGTKRRGPRTTIKAKQLETLKAAFAATPKPTRHIREQLAQETGLNMRVIQVWFQNRRSKERRMKQLRYGSFRPGSRRSRNALVRGDDPSLVSESSGLFPEGISRGEESYYHHAMYNYCDIFGAEHPGSSRPDLGLPPGAPPFMLTHHGDDVVSGMDPHQTGIQLISNVITTGLSHSGTFLGEPTYLLDGRPLRPQPSPDTMNMAPEDVYRNPHSFNGPLSVANIKPEPGMPTVRW